MFIENWVYTISCYDVFMHPTQIYKNYTMTKVQKDGFGSVIASLLQQQSYNFLLSTDHIPETKCMKQQSLSYLSMDITYALTSCPCLAQELITLFLNGFIHRKSWRCLREMKQEVARVSQRNDDASHGGSMASGSQVTFSQNDETTLTFDKKSHTNQFC